jgi:hypothetical protein
VAGVLVAGAGFGVAFASTVGDSNQYTHGAKPYAGIKPNDITIGTETITNPLITTTIAVPTVTNIVTTTSTLTVPYATTVTSTKTSTVTQTSTVTNTKTNTVTSPYAVTTPGTTSTVTSTTAEAASAAAAAAAANEAKSESLTIGALIKIDLRQLLQPSGSYLTTAKLAKVSKLNFGFYSPGSGTVKVLWKLVVKGRNKNRAVNLVSYTRTLTKVGDVTVTLPLTTAGRKLLKGAKNGTIAATVTYAIPKVGSVTVHRNYKLVG